MVPSILTADSIAIFLDLNDEQDADAESVEGGRTSSLSRFSSDSSVHAFECRCSILSSRCPKSQVVALGMVIDGVAIGCVYSA